MEDAIRSDQVGEEEEVDTIKGAPRTDMMSMCKVEPRLLPTTHNGQQEDEV